MTLLLSDAQFNSLALVVIALITTVGAFITTRNSSKAKSNSADAKQNSEEAKRNSEEAKQNSADVLNEVQTNGGMSSPEPNLNDHIKHQTKVLEEISEMILSVDDRLKDHLKSHKFLDPALAKLYLTVKPDGVFPSGGIDDN